MMSHIVKHMQAAIQTSWNMAEKKRYLLCETVAKLTN
jgi:hypothetical protein